MAVVRHSQNEADLFYSFLSQHHPGTVTVDMLEPGGWSQNRAREAANALHRQRKIKISTSPAGELQFEYVPPHIAQKLNGLEPNAVKIYGYIEKRGDQGAKAKDLKTQLQMQERQVNAICRELKTKKLIKNVSTLDGNKTFMLTDVDPHPNLCGGSFHAEGSLDKARIEDLRNCCREVLDNAKPRSVKLEEFHEHILHKGNQGKSTSREEVDALLRTLVLDGEFLMATGEGEKTYKLNGRSAVLGFDFFGGRHATGRDMHPRDLQHAQLERGRFAVPCLACPLAEECIPGGRVCPEECEYLTRWLHAEPERQPNKDEPMVIDW